jgi:hypothetical protein
VNRIVSAQVQPICESTRQLGINQELHAANGKIR